MWGLIYQLTDNKMWWGFPFPIFNWIYGGDSSFLEKFKEILEMGRNSESLIELPKVFQIQAKLIE